MLRVGVGVANLSTTDLVIGSEHMGTGFRLSACDGNAYVSEYLRYELFREDGLLVSSTSVQPSCSYATNTRYNCTLRGIPAGSIERFADTDCGGVELDDELTSGRYLMRISVNANRIWLESDYTNNTLEIPLEIPTGDRFAPCSTPLNPLFRGGNTPDCGWNLPTTGATGSCTPFEELEARCTGCSGQGPIALRVCEGDGPCGYYASLAESNTVLPDGEISAEQSCVDTSFICPPSARYNVLVQGLESEIACDATVESLGGE